MHGVYLFINHDDFDFSATVCLTDTFAAMLDRGHSSHSRGDRGGYKIRRRDEGRDRGDDLGFRDRRDGGRGGEVAVDIYLLVFFLMSN